jgi:hypothetical protein
MILRGARVFDATGRLPRNGLAVVIADGRIADVVAEGAVGDGGDAQTVDLSGCVLLPGLIDLHVHLGFGARPARETVPDATFRAARNVRATQAAGVTTIRDVGTANGVAIAARDAVQRGDIPGSRVVPCGQIICMTGGHGSEPPAPPGMAREADGPTTPSRGPRAGAGVSGMHQGDDERAAERRSSTRRALMGSGHESHRRERRVACHASIPAYADGHPGGSSNDGMAATRRRPPEHGRGRHRPGADILVTTLTCAVDEFKTIPMMHRPGPAKRHVES